jgi:ribonuclease BN (tRNA processing enzyme)
LNVVTLTLTVLGCAATFPRPDNPSSGYLVRTTNASVWVDCGSGTFAALQRHLDLSELTAIWVSHLHPDHCADLLSVFNWAANTEGVRRLPVYGPPGWADRLSAMLPSDDAADLVGRVFDVHSLGDGHSTQVGDMTLHTRAVDHGVPAFGLKATHGRETISYSGDSGLCLALVELASDVDLFVCEAGAATPQLGHCTVADATSAAAQGRSRQLLLTHLGDGVDATPALAEATSCPIAVATPDMKITIGN